MSWTIKQIQIFFYNGCDNRWQIYQEGESDIIGGTESGRFFRAQITKLLRTVRDALTKSSIVDAGVSPPERSGGEVAMPPEPEPLEIRFPTIFDDPTLQTDFSTFILNALENEGVVDKILRKAIRSSSPGDQQVVWKVAQASLPNLISLLPMARDWDIVGWLHPMSTSSVRFQPYSYWWRNFAYRVRFVPRAGESTDPEDQPLHDRDVFFSMYSKAPWDNNESYRAYPDPRTEIAYFDFAKSPRKERKHIKQQKMSESEWNLYRLYAAVIDSSQQAGSEESRSYYMVLPVIACGYFHFLELQMQPAVGESDALCECYQYIIDKVSGNDYYIMKDSLRELLVQIRLSAFQHHVNAWITRNVKRIFASKDPAKLAIKCFCELSPLINEMRAIATEQTVWSHSGRRNDSSVWRVLKRWGPVKKANVERDKKTQKVTKITLPEDSILLADDYHCVPIGSGAKVIEVWLFHRSVGDTTLAQRFFEGTNRRRLEEQFEVVQERVRRVWQAAGI